MISLSAFLDLLLWGLSLSFLSACNFFLLQLPSAYQVASTPYLSCKEHLEWHLLSSKLHNSNFVCLHVILPHHFWVRKPLSADNWYLEDSICRVIPFFHRHLMLAAAQRSAGLVICWEDLLRSFLCSPFQKRLSKQNLRNSYLMGSLSSHTAENPQL